MTILFVIVQSISYLFLITESNDENLNTANMISSSIIILIIVVLIKKSKFPAKSKKEKIKKIKTDLFLIMSFIVWFIAEVLYGLISYIPNSIVYPSSADVFYVLGYIFFIVYLHQLNKIYKLNSRIVISFIITISLFILYFLYTSFYIFHIFEMTDSILSTVLSFLYPILDAYIVVIALLYYFHVKTISLKGEHISWIFIASGFILFFIGDFTYGYNFMIKIDDTFLRFFNLYYNIGYTIFGISFLIRYKKIVYFSTKYDKL